MDWAKAKNMLIAALLVVNLVLGGLYLGGIREKKAEIGRQAESTRLYLQSCNIDVPENIPTELPRLPAVTVSFSEGAGRPASCGGYPLVIEGTELGVGKLSSGKVKAEVLPASAALLKAAGDLQAQKRSVSSIELVYYIDREGYTQEDSVDTALPYWRLTDSEGGVSYYCAFAE